MIRIHSIEQKPIHEINYEFPASGGRVESAKLEVFHAYGIGIPAPLRALIVMSDLQGREHSSAQVGKERRLLGEVVAEELSLLCEMGELPPSKTIGVVLAGDLFVVPELDKRGGKGDVRGVWQLFRDKFRWVAGTGGNHDRFGSDGGDVKACLSGPGIYYLDAEIVEVDGLAIGGVAGVIGNPSKPFRREEARFLDAIDKVAARRPDLLILHEGPSGHTTERPGNAAVRDQLERAPPTLVICGHNHWHEHEMDELANGTQVVNADARAYVIESS